MKTNERKQKAVQLMKEMDIFKPYIEEYQRSGRVTYFERYIGYWADQEPELQAKIEEFEQEQNCTVYAVTHEYFEFGECYTFLIVTNYKQDWKYLMESNNDKHLVQAYVWNVDCDYCSEFGLVTVKSRFGGIRRIA